MYNLDDDNDKSSGNDDNDNGRSDYNINDQGDVRNDNKTIDKTVR